MFDDLVPVILAGGAGTRLWPESRRDDPKPFMRVDRAGTLSQKTLLRAATLGRPVLTVTGEPHLNATMHGYRQVESGAELDFVAEPMGRNTAPAVALAAMDIAARLGPEQRLLIMPADHLIGDMVAFRAAVGVASELAREGWLVTFGIQPEHPETGYGYIKRGEPLSDSAYRVERFVEKPDRARAEQFLAEGGYDWNAGMFCFSCATLEAAMRDHCPDVWDAAAACFATGRRSGSVLRFDPDAFAAMPSISIDYALMERAPNVAVAPCRIDWSDIGSWQALAAVAEDDAENTIAIDCERTFIRGGKRLIAAVGTRDLAIVDSPDALLVCDLQRSQQVKDVVAQLQAQRDQRATRPVSEHFDWGRRVLLAHHGDVELYRLVIEPGATCTRAFPASTALLLEDGHLEIGDRSQQSPQAIATPLPAGALRNQSSTPACLIETCLRA